MGDIFSQLMDSEQLGSLSSLALAHVGDAVFELMVRSWLAAGGKATSGSLHKDTVQIVNAKAQADFIKLLEPALNEEELAVFKRGRNTRVNSVPKHMRIADYHAATGFEALFGWLWLKGDKERLNELFEMISNKIIEA
ncbi:MAG: ribonuclease III domain-containing protein [Clostridiales bacterium]|nr:ribonuclease III domain-containing protein [Clostridiales bacterium]